MSAGKLALGDALPSVIIAAFHFGERLQPMGNVVARLNFGPVYQPMVPLMIGANG